MVKWLNPRPSAGLASVPIKKKCPGRFASRVRPTTVVPVTPPGPLSFKPRWWRGGGHKQYPPPPPRAYQAGLADQEVQTEQCVAASIVSCLVFGPVTARAQYPWGGSGPAGEGRGRDPDLQRSAARGLCRGGKRGRGPSSSLFLLPHRALKESTAPNARPCCPVLPVRLRNARRHPADKWIPSCRQTNASSHQSRGLQLGWGGGGGTAKKA